MEIKGPGQPPLPTGNQPVTPRSLPWSNGQLLDATLVKRDTGSLLLQIGDSLVKTAVKALPDSALTAPTSKTSASIEQLLARLQPGDPLSLKLVSIKGQPAFKLLLPPPDPAVTIANALRVALPKQDSLAPLLANLAFLQQGNDTKLEKLPFELRQLVETIVKQWSTPADLRNPDLLKRAILNSGVFVEQQLSQPTGKGPDTLSGDVRIALTRLAALIRSSLPQTSTEGAASKNTLTPANRPLQTTTLPLPPGPARNLPPETLAAQLPAKMTSLLSTVPPPSIARPTPQPRSLASLSVLHTTLDALQELLRQTESALARIQSQQLNSANNTDPQRTNLLFELPIRSQDGMDMFQFRIHRDAGEQHQDGSEAPWSVSLAFELERLGPVRVLITILNEHVSVTFWAEAAATQQLFREHMSALQSNLTDAGLSIGRLSCQAGEPDSPEFGRDDTPRLMDERA